MKAALWRPLSQGNVYVGNPSIAGARPPVARGTFITQAVKRTAGAFQRVLPPRPHLAAPRVAAPLKAQRTTPIIFEVRRALAQVPLRPRVAPRIVAPAPPRGPPAKIVSLTRLARPAPAPIRPHLAKPVVGLPAMATRAFIVSGRRTPLTRGQVLVGSSILGAPPAVAPARGLLVFVRTPLGRGHLYLPNPAIQGAPPPLKPGLFVRVRSLLGLTPPRPHLARPVVAVAAAKVAPAVIHTVRAYLYGGHVHTARPVVAPAPPSVTTKAYIISGRRPLAAGHVHVAPPVVAPAPPLPRGRFVTVRAQPVRGLVRVARPVIAPALPAVARGTFIFQRARPYPGHVHLAGPVINTAPLVPPVARGTFITTRARPYRGHVLLPNPAIQGAPSPVGAGLFKMVRRALAVPPLRPRLPRPVIVLPTLPPPMARGTIILTRARPVRGKVYLPNPLIPPGAGPPPMPRGLFVYVRRPLSQPSIRWAPPIVLEIPRLPLRGPIFGLTPRLATRPIPPRPHLAKPIVKPAPPAVARGRFVYVRRPLSIPPPRVRRAAPILAAPPPSVPRGTFITVALQPRWRPAPPRFPAAPPLLSPAPPPLPRGTFKFVRAIARKAAQQPRLAPPIVGPYVPPPPFVAPRAKIITPPRVPAPIQPRPHLAPPSMARKPVGFIRFIGQALAKRFGRGLPPRPHLARPLTSPSAPDPTGPVRIELTSNGATQVVLTANGRTDVGLIVAYTAVTLVSAGTQVSLVSSGATFVTLTVRWTWVD